MSLRDFVVETRAIALRGDQKLQVRGIAFDDLLRLLSDRRGLIDQAFKLVGDAKFDPESADEQQLRKLIGGLVAALPDLAAELIALAADEPDMAPTARRLPAPVQLDALIAIYEMTFTEPAGLGKFFDRLADIVKAMPRPTTAVSLNASIGSKPSGATSASSARKATAMPAATPSGS